MPDKPIFFIDNDFVSDLFGRTSFDAESGSQALTDLLNDYDIRLTSTVLKQINQAETRWCVKCLNHII